MHVGRAALGCLVAIALLVGLMLLVRPAIFMLAPPRDDSRVAIGSSAQLAERPRPVDVALSRSYGHDGERELGEGRVQISLIVSPVGTVGVTVLNAASPVEDDCPVGVSGETLTDCDGRRWTWEGDPLDEGIPGLQRFAVERSDGTLRVDLTQASRAPGG